jgi:signal transduction histidine kinase
MSYPSARKMPVLVNPDAEQIGRPSRRVAIGRPTAPSGRRTLADAALGSLTDAVVVVNRHGIIMAANAAWTDLGERAGVPPQAIGPGTDYFEASRRVAAARPQEADAALAGIRAVCRGASESFETVCRGHSRQDERWCVLRATPLRHPDGGTVIAHTDISPSQVAELARLTGGTAKLVAAQEEERARIARELHDDIAQRVALLATRVDAMLRDSPRARNRMRAGLLVARTHLEELSTAIHTLSHHLHPGKLKLLGLVPTLGTLCRDLSADGTIDISLDAENVPANVADDTAMCIFRVAQEALHNVVKHSGARAIRVQLSGTGSHLTLRVTDDGAGFDPFAVVQSPGIGLLTMRERVELLGGTLYIESVRPHGTMIEATVPLAGRDEIP